MVSPSSVVSGINDLIFKWQKTGLVSDSRRHQAYQRANGVVEITWGDDGFVLKDENFSSLGEYLNLIENRQYSMLLSDGDFLQISFSIKRGRVVKHRLCWYPSPVKFLAEDLEAGSVVDVVLDKLGSGNFSDFYSKGPIRFDFDPDNATEEHPAVHLHMVTEGCRIPVKSPLCLKSFIDFVVNNFYSDYSGILGSDASLLSWSGSDLLTAGQKSRLHINSFESLSLVS